MSILSSILGTGAAEAVGAVGNVVDKLFTSKEEKMQLENEMRKAENDYNLENRRLGIEEEKVALQDTADARKTASEIQTSANATTLSKNTGPYLALGTVLLTFVLFFVLTFLDPQKDRKEIILYILGVLSANATQIFSFYFGSSQGSRDKSVNGRR